MKNLLTFSLCFNAVHKSTALIQPDAGMRSAPEQCTPDVRHLQRLDGLEGLATTQLNVHSHSLDKPTSEAPGLIPTNIRDELNLKNDLWRDMR
jgi:hypothetical protein